MGRALLLEERRSFCDPIPSDSGDGRIKPDGTGVVKKK